MRLPEKLKALREKEALCHLVRAVSFAEREQRGLVRRKTTAYCVAVVQQGHLDKVKGLYSADFLQNP